MIDKPKFHLFVFEAYYPSGGADDHIGIFCSVEDAKAKHKEFIDDQSRVWGCSGHHAQITDDRLNVLEMTYCETATCDVVWADEDIWHY